MQSLERTMVATQLHISDYVLERNRSEHSINEIIARGTYIPIRDIFSAIPNNSFTWLRSVEIGDSVRQEILVTLKQKLQINVEEYTDGIRFSLPVWHRNEVETLSYVFFPLKDEVIRQARDLYK